MKKSKSVVDYQKSIFKRTLKKEVFMIFILLFMGLSRFNPAKCQDYESKVDTLMNPLVEQGFLGGVILIADEEKKVFKKGYGYADRKKKIPNTQNTRFRISSITKVFTALAVMQLYEKGLLDIYKPIRQYFRDLPAGERVTIFHLLTHTSGIPSYNWKKSNNKPVSLITVYKWIKNLPLEFKPGTGFLYSNSGYVLLTMIIKKASGMSYEEYLKNNILSLLGMDDTGLTRMNKPIKKLAIGYSKSGYTRFQPTTRPTMGQGDGDLYSTASDLLKLVQGFYADRIVSEKSRKLMTRLHKGQYGIGWFIRQQNAETLVYHPGGSLGYISNLRIYKQGKKILINLFNSDFLLYSQVDSELESIVLNKSVMPIFSDKKNVKYIKSLKPFLGEYRIDDNETFKIFLKNKKLFFQEKGFPECPAYIYEKNKIYVMKNNYRITFIKDDSGFRFTGLFGLYLVEGPKVGSITWE